MSSFNVLISSAAAKVSLLQAFIAAAEPYGGKVYTSDAELHCAAGFFAHKHFQVRKLSDPEALPELLKLSAEYKIRLLVPTRDGELEFFAEHRAAFTDIGVTILVPTPDQLNEMSNKQRFSDSVEAFGLKAVPRIDPPQESGLLPIFVRPITGAGGFGARQVSTLEDIKTVPEADFLFHPLITAPEYSADLLMSLDGSKAIGVVCRERIKVVAGESKISKVTRNPYAEAEICRLGEKLGMVGHNTLQFFDHPEQGIIFIEVNPRFGGASSLSIEAGLDSPRRILAMLDGNLDLDENIEIQEGLTMYRYSQDKYVVT